MCFRTEDGSLAECGVSAFDKAYLRDCAISKRLALNSAVVSLFNSVDDISARDESSLELCWD